MTVTHRDEQARSGSKYIPVLVWRINSVEQMAWLMCQGVDGEESSEKILFFSSWDCSRKGGRSCVSFILIYLFHSPGQLTRHKGSQSRGKIVFMWKTEWFHAFFLAKKTLIIINHAFYSGVYTDEPRLLSMMSQRRELGDIVCCATWDRFLSFLLHILRHVR